MKSSVIAVVLVLAVSAAAAGGGKKSKHYGYRNYYYECYAIAVQASAQFEYPLPIYDVYTGTTIREKSPEEVIKRINSGKVVGRYEIYVKAPDGSGKWISVNRQAYFDWRRK
jgi:hypothetical protein